MIWLRLPAGWPLPVAVGFTLIILTGLDLVGTVAAKEAVDRQSPVLAAGGALAFVAMFWVFASQLATASLTVVEFGWCVLLQIGVLLLDRFRYGLAIAPTKWAAIAVVLAAQTYLILGPAGERSSAQPDEPALGVPLSQLMTPAPHSVPIIRPRTAREDTSESVPGPPASSLHEQGSRR